MFLAVCRFGLRALIALLTISIFCLFLLYLYGIWSIQLEVEPNACRMTYMYEEPQYQRMHVKNQKLYAQYGLYYYYEGQEKRHLERKRSFTGAPVLFVPGNGGAYKQVRSLASVARQKSLDTVQRLELDFFSVDLNEELSGLHGGYLWRQQAFLKQSILSILALYKQSPNNDTTNIILIGHSMGGKVAQSMLLDKRLAKAINSIVYIATPLDQPVLNLDPELETFYSSTNAYMDKYACSSTVTKTLNYCSQTELRLVDVEAQCKVRELAHVLQISIGSGNRDILVHDALTRSRYSDLNVMSASVPQVWLSCDHLSSVWCLQLMQVINRFIYGILDAQQSKPLKFIKQKSLRLAKAYDYFSEIPSHTNHQSSPAQEEKLNEAQSVWRSQIGATSYSRVYEHRRQGICYELFEFDGIKQDVLLLELTNMPISSSRTSETATVYGCIAQLNQQGQRYCAGGLTLPIHLQRIYVLPGTKNRSRYVVLLELLEISKLYPHWTHLALRIPLVRKQAQLRVDAFKSAARSLNVIPSSWPYFSRLQLLPETKTHAIYYKLSFPTLTESYQAYELQLSFGKCATTAQEPKVVTKLCVPWLAGVRNYRLYGSSANEPIRVLVTTPTSRPALPALAAAVTLELYLDPSCQYSLAFKPSLGGSLARVVRQFAHSLPAHFVAVALIALNQHRFLAHSAHKQQSRSFHLGFLQPLCSLLLLSLNYLWQCTSMHRGVPNSLYPDELPTCSIYITLLLHASALIVVLLLAKLLQLLLRLCCALVRRLAMRSFAKQPAPPGNSHGLYPATLPLSNWYVASAAIALLSVGLFFAGSLALCVGFVLAFVQLVRSSCKDEQLQRSISPPPAEVAADENLRKDPEHEHPAVATAKPNLTAASKFITARQQLGYSHYELSLLLLLLLQLLLNLPSLVAYLKSWSFNPGVKLSDATLLPSTITLLCWFAARHFKPVASTPRRHSSRCGLMSSLLYLTAFVCLSYATEAVYRLNFLLTFVFILVLIDEAVGGRLMK